MGTEINKSVLLKLIFYIHSSGKKNYERKYEEKFKAMR